MTGRELAERIGERVEGLRGERFTIPDLADKVGVDRTHMWRISSGRALPSLDLLQKLADVFGVDVATFFVRRRAGRAARRLSDNR